MTDQSKRFRELTRVLRTETDLVRQLGESLVRQRGAVASNDLDRVQTGIDEVGTVLVKLDKTRSLRGRIVKALTGREPEAIAELERAMGGRLPESVARARAELVQAAEAVAQQAAINHNVFRRAVEAGETFLQTVFSYVGQETALYHRPDGAHRPKDSSSVFVNRVG